MENSSKPYFKKVALHYSSGNVYIRNAYAAECALLGNAEQIDRIGAAKCARLRKRFEGWVKGNDYEFMTGLKYLYRITFKGYYTTNEISNVKWDDYPDKIENPLIEN